jgi:hypothetical protein
LLSGGDMMATLEAHPENVLALQRTAGNRATTSFLARAAATRLLLRTAGDGAVARATVQRQPVKTAKDKPVDVVEAVVHMMSNRGLSGDVGREGENESSPRYAPEVAGTVLEQEHKTLLWVWYLIAVGDSIAHADRAKIAEAHAQTAPLIAQMNADKSLGARRGTLAARYAAGLEALTQRAAREQVDDMIEAGVAVAGQGQTKRGFASEDDRLRFGVDEARRLLDKTASLTRRTLSAYTTGKLTAAVDKRVTGLYDQRFRLYLRELFAQGEIPDSPEFTAVRRASGMNFVDGIHLLKGGLDGVSAILAVADPKAREALLRERSNYYGSVAKGAEINAVLWKFVSGSIAFCGGSVYGLARLAGKTEAAEIVLDATVKGVGNVGAALNLAGLVHGFAVILDPDATADQKAEAAVEATISAVGLAGFASRWVPRLAWASRWSGPVAVSLTLNLALFKHLANLRYKAEVGMNRLDWASCYRVTDAAATEVQGSQRQLAVTNAILATETDPRRRVELQKYAEAFRYTLVEQQMKPFVAKRLSSTSMEDDPESCGPALSKRFASMPALLSAASASDEAAMTAAATFLITIDKAFDEWNQIVMEKHSGSTKR